MLAVSWFLCGILYSLFYYLIFTEMVCQEKFKINKNVIIGISVFSICYCFIKCVDSGFIQTYFTQLLIFLILKITYKKELVRTLIGVLELFTISCVSELVLSLILVMSNVKTTVILEDAYCYFISNITILLICIIFSNLKFVKRLNLYIISWYNDNEIRSILLVLMAVTILTFLMYNNFIQLLPSSFLLLTNLFCVCVFIFVVGFFKEKSNNHKISVDYDQLLDYVKVYENVVEEKSKNQHEYRNQMILIRGMIKEKEAIDYIDKMLNNENSIEDNEWLNKLKYVPLGGLKGLIHYKIQEMLKKDISIFVDVSPQLEQFEKSKNLKRNLENISKIIGVYLDNAIEAVKELEEKFIVVEFYIEKDNIVFSLSNNYEGIINLSKIEKEKYTTKGEGHGYGLSLVKDILSKNDSLKQKRELNGIYFVQKLYIKAN